MSLADICLMISVLVVVAVVAKMLRAIRLLDGRVTILQEQLEQSRTTLQRAVAGKLPPHKLSSGKTPIEGVSVVPAAAAVRRAPAPIEPEVSQDSRSPGEATTHVIDQTEADAIYAQLSAEQERLKKAMGRDFQVRTPKRPVGAGSRQEAGTKVENRLWITTAPARAESPAGPSTQARPAG